MLMQNTEWLAVVAQVLEQEIIQYTIHALRSTWRLNKFRALSGEGWEGAYWKEEGGLI